MVRQTPVKPGRIAIVADVFYTMYSIVDSDGRSILVRRNVECVPVAETFGMRLRHRAGCTDRTRTDGTIACPACGQTARAFVVQAIRYLDNADDTERTAVDPGYFPTDE